ncbi:chymotrypsin family serine protease [Nocardiopsis oceani]
MQSRSVFAGLGALALALSLAPPAQASAAAAPQEQGPSTLVASGSTEVEVSEADFARAEELGNPDAAPYAAEHDLSVEESVDLLQTQQLVGEAGEEVAQSLGEDDAGLRIEHEPEFRVIVSTAGDAEDVEIPESLAGLDVPVEVVEEEYSLADIERYRGQVQDALEAEGIAFDSYGDVAANQAVVDVAEDVPEEVLDATASSRTEGEAPVLINAVDQLGEAEADLSGGVGLTTCTAGFVVIIDGRRMVTTAAHCQDDQRMLSADVALFHEDESHGGSHDVQAHFTWLWHDFLNRIYVGTSANDYRTITGTVSRGDSSVGNYRCKRGKNSGYGCSYIDSLTVSPSYVPDANETFIGMEDHNTERGDSGGPWFIVGNAAGSHVGSASGGSVYMSVSYFGGAIDATVATS